MTHYVFKKLALQRTSSESTGHCTSFIEAHKQKILIFLSWHLGLFHRFVLLPPKLFPVAFLTAEDFSIYFKFSPSFYTQVTSCLLDRAPEVLF